MELRKIVLGGRLDLETPSFRVNSMRTSFRCFSQPSCAPAQISGERGKPLALVGHCTPVVCSGVTSNHNSFVDVHSAAEWTNDFDGP